MLVIAHVVCLSIVDRTMRFAPILVALFIATLAAGCGGDEADGHTENTAGLRVYRTYCLSCHQADGGGIQGMYPPLQQTEWTEGDRGRLIRLILYGMAGPIEVNGQRYNNVMPAHGHLSDDQIADVLTFVRSNFGNDAPAVTADDVFAVRRASERRGMWRPDELESATGIPPTGEVE